MCDEKMQSIKKGIIQPCSDTSDAVPFLPSQQLYLKPIACFHISVQLPSHKLKEKSVSNKEIVDKLKHWIEPEVLTLLRVSKSTIEFIRFDAEIENRSKLRALLSRLNGKTIKLSNISELLKVRASEVKPDFPTKHDWDAYFRDARNMNEMKAGERPDTIYLANLPCEWFKSRHSFNKPCENIFRRAFEQFGEVSRVDIPLLDRYRPQMKTYISGVKIFTFNQDTIFEGYVQFREYSAFMKAMDALRGMKLLYKDNRDNAFTASMKVEFDKTKHLSDALVLRRNIVREKLIQRDREREEKERRKTEEEEKKKAEEREKKMARRKLREEKRKEKHLAILKQKDVIELNKKIEMEEKLMVVAQRKLESIRLLGELFDRVKNEKLKKLDEKEKRRSKKDKEPAPKTLQDLVKVDHNFDEENLKKILIEKYKRKRNMESLEKETSKSFSREGVSENNRNMRSVVETVYKDDNRMDNRNSYRGNGNYRGGGQQRHWNNDHDFREEEEGTNENNRYYRGSRGRGRYNARGRGNYQRWRNGYELPHLPLMDPLLLQYTHDYYKYMQMFAKRGMRNRRSSRSRSRSYSRHRSRSRSYSRSRSRSRSHGRYRTRSRSYSRSSKGGKRSRSKSGSRSKSRTKNTSERKRTKSKSVSRSSSRVKNTSERKRTKSKSVSRSKS